MIVRQTETSNKDPDKDDDFGSNHARADGLDRPNVSSLEPKETGRGSRRFSNVVAPIQAVANVATAVAAGLLLLEFWTNGVERERERSLELVQAWSNDGHANRFANVQAIIERRRFESGLDQMRLPREGLPTAHANIAATLALEGIERRIVGGRAPTDDEAAARDEFVADVDRVILFFERMDVCLAAELCDAAVLKAFFEPTVVSSWEYFVGYARVRRKNGYPQFGERVPSLIERFARIEE